AYFMIRLEPIRVETATTELPSHTTGKITTNGAHSNLTVSTTEESQPMNVSTVTIDMLTTSEQRSESHGSSPQHQKTTEQV
ncbi:hypothetical protein PENTCL1PPCAC_21188, partial [Pristionchus entomophagus]